MCLNITSCFRKEGEIVNYPLDLEPVALDPCKVADFSGLQIAVNVFEGLTEISKNGEILPAAAKSFSFSNDKKTVTFEIDPEAKWSNGESVSAKDFLFSIKRTISPDTNSPNAHMLYPILNAKEINQKNKDINSLGVKAEGQKLTITYTDAYPDILQMCSTIAYFPCNEEFFNKTQGKYGLEQDMLMGNGRYYLRKWVHGENMRLSLNEHHREYKKATVTNVLFSIGKEYADIALSLKKDLVSIAKVSENQANELRAEGYEVENFEDTTWGFYLNTEDEILKNKNIRKALFEAIEREGFLKINGNEMKEAKGIIPPSSKMGEVYYREKMPQGVISAFDYTVAQAALKTGRKELKYDDKKALKISLICSNDKETVSMLGYILQSWQKYLSVFVSLEPLEPEALAKRIQEKNFQMVYHYLRGEEEDPLSTLEIFTSNNQRNILNLSSFSFDALLDNCQKVSGDDKINKIKECEEFLYKERVFYPIAFETRHFAKASKSSIVLHGFEQPIIFK